MTIDLDGITDNAALARLCALVPLDEAGRNAVRLASERSRRIMPRREVQVEGSAIREPLLVLRGWAARIRILSDGRRQITNFTLPGDLVGLYRHDRPVASSTIVALTPVTVCTAPDASASSTLGQAYAVSAAHDEAYLLAQIARLGRLNAHERIADLLLELLERLGMAGLATQGRFGLPLTQETLADALGLTAVHVNRMLQQARRAGEISWQAKEMVIHDPAALARQVGRAPVQVSG
ncbi:cyclic nucleotide-binding protein [Sphingomonas sp. Leaf412]|uniref:Crp/Fnr family transcriptional regulator n=1 Tax=Sphingomonas sp. Leaf412 TaxID=1736370 RepID=UPI0006FD5BE2|nr:Crp/Fnr family transcriptional regulator [Sphingomonas sp. Leaf412]KQT32893.1 cyclic nucleotide-binding protein [Sphingomonas sp. Leaf412]